MSENGLPTGLLGFVGRHLIGLGVYYRTRSDKGIFGTPKFAVYSGTLINIDYHIFYLTAGHVLRNLEEYLANDRIAIERAILVDTFGLGRISHHPIPFELKDAEMLYLDEDGLDFGIIPLNANYVRLLAANGAVALREINWLYQETVKFDAHMILGLPEEYTTPDVKENGEVDVSSTLIIVDELPLDSTDEKSYRRFKGRIAAEVQLGSPVGMSGGPIFGIQMRPVVQYWVVALQSSWIPDTRIVYGCPLPVLASLLTRWAEGFPIPADV